MKENRRKKNPKEIWDKAWWLQGGWGTEDPQEREEVMAAESTSWRLFQRFGKT